jgi:hypothetical protein
MRANKLEQQLADLSMLRAGGPSDASIATLRQALAHKSNLVVAKAAAIAAEFEQPDLIPQLLAAWSRFFENAVDSDPQCWGKNALVRALKDLRHDSAPTYVRGLHHVQMEPVWGGSEDTAPTLRGACALALTQCLDLPRVVIGRHLVEALGDPKQPVRIDVIRAIEGWGGEEASLLLRLKAKLGDKEPAVVGQALESLLRLENSSALPFVDSFIDGGGELAEEAALALGASRLPRAFDLLVERYSLRGATGLGPVLLRSLSLLRSTEAIDFLLQLVRSTRISEAMHALEALSLHASTTEITVRAREAAFSRSEEGLRERADKLFKNACDPF